MKRKLKKMICKHIWHFATDDAHLTCSKCGKRKPIRKEKKG